MTTHDRSPKTEISPSLFELLVRDDPRLDELAMDPAEHMRVTRSLLALSIGSTVLYGAVVGIAAVAYESGALLATEPALAAWLGAMPFLTLPGAFTAAFMTALCVCLPSFYFYTQLSGLDASLRLIVVQALRVHGRTAVLLLGALPVYAACALSVRVGADIEPRSIILLGLGLPFGLGLFGLASLYRSFARLSRQLPRAHRRRPHFLGRLVLAWGAVYSVVCPVALHRIGAALVALVG